MIDSMKVYGYAMFKDDKVAAVKYPVDDYVESGAHDFEVAGRSFHNGRFVQRLRAAAAGQPLVTLRQAVVKDLIGADGSAWVEGKGSVCGVKYRQGEAPEREARAHLTVCCDGMYSTFRKSLMEHQIVAPSYFVGLLMRGEHGPASCPAAPRSADRRAPHPRDCTQARKLTSTCSLWPDADCQLPFPNHGHVILGDPSPVLFYPISPTEVRCLVDIPGDKLPSQSNGRPGGWWGAGHVHPFELPHAP